MSRRRELADAAIGILAQEGMRGLTHRAVDRAARLPEGSTSYYFRTRHALLKGVVERLAERTGDELTGAEPPPAGDLDALVEGTAVMFERWLGVELDRQRARYELMLESVRRPDLHQSLLGVRNALRDEVTAALVAAGISHAERRTHHIQAYLDGILLARVTDMGPAPDPGELRAGIRGLLTG